MLKTSIHSLLLSIAFIAQLSFNTLSATDGIPPDPEDLSRVKTLIKPPISLYQVTNSKGNFSDKKLLRAEEVKHLYKLYPDNLVLFDLTPDGLFLRKDEQKLFLMSIREDGTVETKSSTILPTIDKKEFYTAVVISDRFVNLSYGVQIDDMSESEDLEDTNFSPRSYNKDVEHIIWDAEKSDVFKVDNPDFTSCYMEVENDNNPQRMLVHESIYKLDGDFKDQSRYRYYNLETRQFLDLIVLGFQKNHTYLFTSTDDHGRYRFRFATQHYVHPPQFNIVRVRENEDSTVSIGEIVYSIATPPLHHCLTNYSHPESPILIFYRSAGDGLRVPYYLDLNHRNPMERPLLTSEETEDLKSNVYHTMIEDGALCFTTHFERKRLHFRPLGALGAYGKFIEELYSFSQQPDTDMTSNAWPVDFQHNMAFLLKFEEIFKKHSAAFTPRENSTIQRVLSEPFRKYLHHILLDGLPTEKLIRIKHDVISTADPKLQMPIYYTLPTIIDPNGWFIVDIHGGPHYREFNELDLDQQFYTSRGFPYLKLNIRGSTGFGNNYGNASDGNWYGVIDDIKKAIDWAKDKGLGTKPIVIGGSFGGYAAAATHAKGYANAVVAINGVFDLEKHIDAFTTARSGKSSSKIGVDKWLNLHTSISTQVGRTPDIRKTNSVTTHLTCRPGAKMLIIAGLKDTICHPEQSKLLYQQMVELGNHAEFITMADEGHSPVKPESVHMIYRVVEQFLGELTGHPYESNGYETLGTTSGIFYQKNDEEQVRYVDR